MPNAALLCMGAYLAVELRSKPSRCKRRSSHPCQTACRSSAPPARHSQPGGNAGREPPHGPLAAHPEPRGREATAQAAAGAAMRQPWGPALAAAGGRGCASAAAAALAPHPTCDSCVLPAPGAACSPPSISWRGAGSWCCRAAAAAKEGGAAPPRRTGGGASGGSRAVARLWRSAGGECVGCLHDRM